MKFNESYKKLLIGIVFAIFIIIAIIHQLTKESQLTKNSKLGIGRLMKIEHGGNTSDFRIKYDFFHNGKKIKGIDPLNVGWPVHLRNGKPVIKGYSPVEYDSENPQNAKIIIQKKPYTPKQLLANSDKVQGLVENTFKVSDYYVDLKISYSYGNERFNFRTRLHKDSLLCGTLDSCKGSSIQLKINKFYPELNDFYFKSYDKKHLLKENGFN
jgi:hypothetical protein